MKRFTLITLFCSLASVLICTDIFAQTETQGDKGAIKSRDYAASKLSPEDLSVAQKRVANLYEEIQQRKK